jgi:hypothetical protein
LAAGETLEHEDVWITKLAKKIENQKKNMTADDLAVVEPVCRRLVFEFSMNFVVP